MQFQHPLLPTAWHSLCHNIAKQNGISTDASALLILGSYATACGDTVQIRTPDQIALGPMIHLALVANGVSFPRGALTSLLAELVFDSEVTREQRDAKGIRVWKAAFEGDRRRPELLEEIQAAQEAAEKPMTTEQLTAGYSAVERMRTAHRQRAAAGRQELAGIDKLLQQSSYILSPEVIVNEPNWRELATLASRCFDGRPLAICFAQGLSELHDLNPVERRHCLQATSLDRRGLIQLEYGKFPLSIVAAVVGNGGTLESGAFRSTDNSGVFVQERMVKPILMNIETRPGHTKLMETVIMTLVHSLSPSVFPFLRSAYFEKRWAFHAMMEACSRKPAIDDVARRYVHGRAAFFAHCELYTGLTPMKWFLSRRMELADRWLHVAHKPVWEVAAALGYRGFSKFRSEFREHFHRHPEDPGVPLGFGRSRNLDSPHCCLRPFWWPYPLPLGQHDFCGPNGPMSANGFVTSFVDYGAPAIRPDIQSAQVQLEGLGTNRFVEPIPMNPREEEAKAFIALFNNLEPIPISDLLPFTAELPALLKAA